MAGGLRMAEKQKKIDDTNIWPFLTAVAIVKAAVFMIIYFNPYTGG